jgi:hypothetical protein
MLAQLKDPATKDLALGFLRDGFYPLVALESLRKARLASDEAANDAQKALKSPHSDLRSEAKRYLKFYEANLRQ